MQEGAFKLDLLDYEYDDISIQNPFCPDYKYDGIGVFESKTHLELQPDSTSCTDIKLEELSCITNLGAPCTQEIKEIKPENSEPCAAALAIEANIPAPSEYNLSKWRTFISSAYYHPNIMAHIDVICLKELFQLFGSDIVFESTSVMIDLGEDSKDYKPAAFQLRPALPSCQKPALFTFAQVSEFFVEKHLKVCIVKNYSIMDSMKQAVCEMVNFIIEYPEALYLETYGFVLDFLLKFGIRSDVIIDTVMRTQGRRRKSKKPASILVLKQANKLGKGRKEFLQKRLLVSPEKKYDPVVPIIAEPTPVRQLRNRRMGGLDRYRTPHKADGCVPNTFNVPTGEGTKSVNSITTEYSQKLAKTFQNIVQAKRRLFSDDDNNPGAKLNGIAFAPSGLSETAELNAQNVSTVFKRKKLYKRRDLSLIEKPFTCTLCTGRSFAYKGNLVLHMKKKHPSVSAGKTPPLNRKRNEDYVPAFTCPVCLGGYSTKYRCKTHILHFHPEHKDWQPLSNLADSPSPPSKSRGRAGLSQVHSCDPRSFTQTKKVDKTENMDSSPAEKSSHLYSTPNSSVCVQSFSSRQDLNIQVSDSFVFDGLQFETLTRVTRNQMPTAVI